MRIVYNKTAFRNAVLRSVISILAGVALIIWKDIALKSIVMFVGALFMVSGIMAFIISYRNMRNTENGDALSSFNGLGSILMGGLLLVAPLVFTTILMYILGIVFIIGSIAQFVTLSAARRFAPVPGVAYVFPLLISVAGIIVLANPWESATSMLLILGGMAVFYGITDLVGQYNINRFRKRFEREHQQYGKDIQDATYEEIEE